MKIKTDIKNLYMPEREILNLRSRASGVLDSLWGSKDPEDAWVQLPMKYTEEDIEYLLNAADYIKGWAKLMIVIGNPASCAGPKAAIGALPKYEYGIEVQFAGNDFNPDRYAQLIDKIKANETVLCLLSDYEDTPETAAAFAILREAFREKLDNKEAVSRRIIAVTDKDSRLWEEAEREGYLTVKSPQGLNGCFNVLAIDGLFPMAAAGLDVRAVLEGAKEAALSPLWDAGGADYAIARHLMARKGYVMEWIVATDPAMEAAARWLKRLYEECGLAAESKDDNMAAGNSSLLCGIRSWPADVYHNRQGSADSFETILRIGESAGGMIVPDGALQGRDLAQLRKDSLKAFVQERNKAESPLAEVAMEKLDGAAFGQMVYFFELSSALTKMLGESC